VTPQPPPNAQLRFRDHLTAGEVEKLIEAAKQNAHGRRLRAEQVVLKTVPLHVGRPRRVPTSILRAGTKCATPPSREARIPLRVCLGTRHGFLIERAAIAAEQRHALLRAAKLANIIQNTTTSADCARHRTIYS
jgi:hypothetical protein